MFLETCITSSILHDLQANRDPRRLHWLLELMIVNPLHGTNGSFLDARYTVVETCFLVCSAWAFLLPARSILLTFAHCFQLLYSVHSLSHSHVSAVGCTVLLYTIHSLSHSHVSVVGCTVLLYTIHSLSHSRVSVVGSICSSPYWPSRSGGYPVYRTESWSTSSPSSITPSRMSGNASEGVHLCGSLPPLRHCFP